MKTLIRLFTTVALLVFLLISFNSYSQGCKFQKSPYSNGFKGATFGVKLGDIDGDGDQDAVTFNAYDSLEVWYNNGNGQFTDSSGVKWSSDWYYGIEMADIDSDNDSDLVVTAFGLSAKTTVLKNDGNGNFTVSQSLSADDTRHNELADLDNDGYPDLFSTGNTPEIWLNNGNGNFSSNGTISPVGGGKNDVALADFDGDGDIDAFMSDDNGSDNELWLNDGNGNFSYSNSYGNHSDYTGIDAADFDNDGDKDVVLIGKDEDIEIWLNDGNGNFTLGLTLTSSNYDKSVVVDDFDQDGNVDIFISTYGSNGLEVWKNNGNASFSLYYQNSGISISSHDLDVGDINGDGLTDIYVGNFSSSNSDMVFFQEKPSVVKDLQFAVCEGDSITINNKTYDSTGTYTQQYACDSLINIDLDVIKIDTSVSKNGCELVANDTGKTYQWYDCSDNYTIMPGDTNRSFIPSSSGNYAVVVSDSMCSDTSSCRYVNYNPQIIDYQKTICYGDSITVNNVTYDSSGTYTQKYGCDSVVNVEINVIKIDTSLTQNGATLIANDSGLVYQWVDCDNNYTPVSGATNQSFTPSSDGQYAVIITDSICSDTSSCYNVQNTGIRQKNSEGIRVYPNPAENEVTMETPTPDKIQEIMLTDIQGRLIRTKKNIQSIMKFNLSQMQKGVYLIHIKGENKNLVRKLVRK